jgi:hypothetical protein
VQDALERVAHGHSEPGLVDEIGRRDVCAAGEAVVGGQADVERLGEERNGAQAPAAPWEQARHRVGEHDVVVAGVIGELLELGVEVGAAHGEPGDLGQVDEHARQQGCTDRGEGEQRDLAARMVAEFVPQRCGALQGDRDVGGASSERLACTRQHDASSAACGQGHPGLALEHLELLRDGGWGATGRVGHGRDAAALGELAQEIESMYVHVASLNYS